MNEYPDSALILLKGIENQNRYGVQKAKYALLYSQALDKNSIDLTTDSIISPAKKYYSKKGTLTDKAKMYFYLGRIYQNANNHNDAMESFILAKDYAYKSKEADYYLLGLISATLGAIYISQNEFDRAINYFNEAINNYKKNDNYKNIMLSYEDLAHAQRMNKQYEAALLSNLQAMNICILLKDTLSLVRQLGSKADIHFYYSNYHKALEVLSKRDKDFSEWVKYSSMLGLYAKIYVKVDSISQARVCANKLHHTAKSPERRASALFLLSQIEKSANNYQDAFFYQKEAYLLSDSLRNIKNENELMILEQKYNFLKLLNDVTTLNRSILFLAGICIVVVILFVFLSFVTRRIISTKRKDLESQLHTIDELKRKCQEFECENNNVQALQKNVLLMHKECIGNTLQILNRVLEIIENRNKDTRSYISLYIKRDKHQKSELLDAIRNIIDLSAPGIINYLSIKYPELSDSDIDLYCINCLKLSKATVCLLLDCSSVQYTYNKISILRKKIGIADSGTSINMHLYACIHEYFTKQNGQ